MMRLKVVHLLPLDSMMTIKGKGVKDEEVLAPTLAYTCPKRACCLYSPTSEKACSRKPRIAPVLVVYPSWTGAKRVA
jgi:hypothetical protein